MNEKSILQSPTARWHRVEGHQEDIRETHSGESVGIEYNRT